MSQKEVICNLCHAKVERVLFDWGITSVMKCDRCGLVFRRIVMELSERELYNFAEKMCDMSHSPTAKYSAAYSEDDSRVMLWKSYLEELDKLNVSEGRKLLDIGSAKGVFLDVAQKRGWEAIGVEPSHDDSVYARQVFELDVFTGTLEEAEFPANQFDVATMWDVVEHLNNPSSTVDEIFRVLKPGGLIYVLTPNHDSLITLFSHLAYKLTLHRFPLERLLYPPVHLYYFTPKTLSGLLHRTGFEIKRVSSAPLHPEKCMVSDKVMRVGASVLDFLAGFLNRGYRISVIASKPLS